MRENGAKLGRSNAALQLLHGKAKVEWPEVIGMITICCCHRHNLQDDLNGRVSAKYTPIGSPDVVTLFLSVNERP
jgi:hypothetical protein